MKNSLAFFGLAAALALPTLSSATPMGSMTWNFLNDVPALSAGVAVGSSHAFTDTKGDSTTITASVHSSVTGFSLFEKNQGASEMGLGVSPESNNEINAGQPGITLNLSDVLNLNPSAIFISLNSISYGDAATITYLDGDHDGDPYTITVNNSHPISLNLAELREENGSILVNATKGNVLIGSITATPEPADAGLMGLGLLAAGFLGRKRFAKQS